MLSGKQRSYLRGEGNSLDPLIHIGKDGISQAVIDQVDELLDDHELIKGRVLDNAPLESRDAAHELAEKTSADVVQVIGSVFLIYRKNEEEPKYKLP